MDKAIARAVPQLEWAVAARPLAGQPVSGDLHLVMPFPNGVLVAVVDGLGHGDVAAAAAKVAVATMERYAHEAVAALMQRCHEDLKPTRGAVMSLASFDARDSTMTWLGVGNVEGVLLRADVTAGKPRDYLPQRGGVVGYQLPPLRVSVVPVGRGDVLIFATDGIRTGFADQLMPHESSQAIADGILARHGKGTDDALVLVARYLGGRA